MNYKYVIAFLGSRQQKDWAKPVSEWMHIQNLQSKDWTEEFKELKSLGRHQEFDPKHVSYFEGSSDGIYIMSNYGAFSYDNGFEVYYNPSKDVIFFYRENETEELAAAGGIENILRFFDQHSFISGEEQISFAEINHEL